MLLSRERGLDLLLLRGEGAHGVGALRAELRQVVLARLDGLLEPERLAAEGRVLLGHGMRRLGAVDHLREALRSGEDVERAWLPADVEGIDPRHDQQLRVMEIRAR